MDIEKMLKDAGVKYEKHEHPTAYTAHDHAATEHVSESAVAKSVVVQADGRPVMCVLPANRRIDLAKLAAVLGARECRLATEAELATLFTDVEVGAEPPFGALYGLETVMDKSLEADEYIVFQAGTHEEAVKMTMAEYRRLAEPKVLSFAYHCR